MKKKWLIVLLSFLVVAILTFLLGQFLSNIFYEIANDHELNTQFKNEISSSFFFRLYIQCFVVLFALGCLPFIFSALDTKVNKNNWWKLILSIEIVGLLLILFTTPPDMISKIIVFILWQLPVSINFILLRLIVKKNS